MPIERNAQFRILSGLMLAFATLTAPLRSQSSIPSEGVYSGNIQISKELKVPFAFKSVRVHAGKILASLHGLLTDQELS